jgi:hypothetical protein
MPPPWPKFLATSMLTIRSMMMLTGIPVFLTGDFNVPSHLDYTEAAMGTSDYVKFVVEWPVSKAIEAAGFRDSWREVEPGPLIWQHTGGAASGTMAGASFTVTM